jgi:hypothetical protein
MIEDEHRMSETSSHTPQVYVPTTGNSAFLVIEQARRITHAKDLDFLEYRKHVGIPLATAILREWLPLQPPGRSVWLDFRGVRAINLSVAEELGPMLMKHITEQAVLGHHYPVYRGLQHDVAHTMHKAFLEMKWATLAYLDEAEIAEGMVGTRLDRIGNHTIVVLGMLTTGQLRILQFINQRYAENGEKTSSSDLMHLDIMAEERVTDSARSKRLTELYQRRLLCYEDNPHKRSERLFAPVWRITTDV